MSNVEEPAPLDLSSLPPLPVKPEVLVRNKRKQSALISLHQFLSLGAFLVAFGLLLGTVGNFGSFAVRTMSAVVPAGDQGTATPVGFSDPGTMRQVTTWMVGAIGAVVILAVLSLAMRMVSVQTRRLNVVPHRMVRLDPPIMVTIQDHNGRPWEYCRLDVDLQLPGEGGAAPPGVSMTDLHAAMSDTVKRVIEESFRQPSRSDLEGHLMSLCRQMLGPYVISAVHVVNTVRQPIVPEAKPEEAQPAPPPPTADELEVLAMQERMVAAREALRDKRVNLYADLSSQKRREPSTPSKEAASKEAASKDRGGQA